MIKNKAGLSIAVLAAGLCFCGAAEAGDVPFTVSAGEGEELKGTVDQDDSSGDMNGATGTASGPISGAFAVNPASPHAELNGAGWTLHVDFDRGDQSLSAHLDRCASPDPCAPGAKAVLWEK